MPTKLLTQVEVAEQLRCSVAKVARLRRDGELRYIPGRPPTIPEAEVEAYIERTALLRAPKPKKRPPETPAELEADARRWVERTMFRRRLRGLKAP